MRGIFNSLLIAFSMYSSIPVPNMNWQKENMKYVMCFFPLIGLVIGLLEWLWYLLCVRLTFSPGLRCAVMVCIPVVVTGGIHLDGLLDASDAASSHADRKERFEIMEDSHVGAFSLIWCCVYFILSYGVFSQMLLRQMPCLCLIFIMSRAMSGYAVCTFPKAKDSGLLKTFSDTARTDQCKNVLLVWMIFSAACCVGLSVTRGIVVSSLGFFTFVLYKLRTQKIYGGITGDLAGAFVEIAELMMSMGCVIVR